MLGILIGGVFITVVMAIAVVGMRPKKYENYDIFSDYKAIRSALILFRKEKNLKCQSLEDIIPYFQGSTSNFSNYELSEDEKFLVVNTIGLKESPEDLIKLVGGTSYVLGNKAFMSFLNINRVSSVPATAIIKYAPEGPIYTTTLLTYNPLESVVEEGFVAQATWENNKRYFSKPGLHLVRLKVKDLNDNWSEWAETFIEVLEKPGISKIATGNDSVFVVLNNGNTYCMGSNDYGQLGIDLLTPQEELIPNSFINIVDDLACGNTHTLFKTYDDRLLAAGRNDFGQLGLASRTDWKTPREVFGVENIKQIAAGSAFSVALTKSGLVYAWGDNELMQLGTDKFTSMKAPRMVENVSDVIQIACSNDHVLALKGDGSVIAWGNNSFGQLAVGFKEKAMLPTLTKFNNIIKVVAGRNASFAITATGNIIACGQNNRSQLAITGHQIVVEPEVLLDLKDIADIQIRGNFAVALNHKGEVYTWGKYNQQDDRHYDIPVKLDGLKGVKCIGATTTHGYAVTNKDELIKWSAAINVRETIFKSVIVETTEMRSPQTTIGTESISEAQSEMIESDS